MSPAQTITTERTADKCLDKRQTNAPTQLREPNKHADGGKCRQSLAAQVAKSSLNSNGNNVDQKTT